MSFIYDFADKALVTFLVLSTSGPTNITDASELRTSVTLSLVTAAQEMFSWIELDSREC